MIIRCSRSQHTLPAKDRNFGICPGQIGVHWGHKLITFLCGQGRQRPGIIDIPAMDLLRNYPLVGEIIN
jgi:hypothetical protein